MSLSRAFPALCALWAVAALYFQVLNARRHRRGPLSAGAGSMNRAVLYNFTIAMLPWRKESVSRHPFAFGAGVVLHAAVFVSFIAASAAALSSRGFASPSMGAVAGAGAAACAFLLLRRALIGELRIISVADDYVSCSAVGLFLVTAALWGFGALGAPWLSVAAGLLLLYLPAGKLRHAVFFFLVRADMGRKLGWRGVYPPARGGRG